MKGDQRPIRTGEDGVSESSGKVLIDQSVRVAHLISSLRTGGTERQLVRMIAEFPRPDLHQIILFHQRGELGGDLPLPPIMAGTLRRSPSGWASNIATLRAVRQAIKDHRADVVHSHLGLSEIVASLAVPRSVPIVASRRGRNVGFEGNPMLRAIEGLGHARIRLLLCNSRYLERYTVDHDHLVPPLRVIYNGIAVDEYLVPDPEVEPFRVAMIANVRPYKRHDIFLRAFAEVLKSLPDASAVIAGDGDLSPLRQLCTRLGISRHVNFVGHVDDVRMVLRDCHIACLTSQHEGFPNALLEALASGRPVVATKVGGIPELVRHGQEGLLTTMDPADVAAALVELGSDRELRGRMSRVAVTRASEFPWSQVVNETERAYLDAIAWARGRPCAG